ncbi:MAG: NYN domain-containing protein [Roseimicrobium sp.]
MAQEVRFLLVDGHSVIHAWDDLRKLHLRSDKRYLARETLLRHMRTVHDVTGQRVVVVFDGVGSQITDEREPSGIQVFYADASHTADAIIERLAAKYASQFLLQVCTADRMIGDGVEASGATWISPESLRAITSAAESEVRGKCVK